MQPDVECLALAVFGEAKLCEEGLREPQWPPMSEAGMNSTEQLIRKQTSDLKLILNGISKTLITEEKHPATESKHQCCNFFESKPQVSCPTKHVSDKISSPSILVKSQNKCSQSKSSLEHNENKYQVFDGQF